MVRSPAADRRPVRAPGGTTTRSRSSCASSTPPAPTSPRTRSARSSASSTVRTTGGCCRRRSATSTSRRVPSRTTPSPWRARSTSAPSPTTRFKVVIDYAYGATSFVMPNVLAKLGADVLAVNPYASTAGMISFDRAELARAGGRPRRGVGRPPRRRARPRRRAPHPHRRRGPRPDRHRGAARRASSWSATTSSGDTVALPVNATMPRRRRSPRAHGITRAATRSCRPPRWPTPPPSRASASPPTAQGGFILPGFLPAFDAAAAFVKVLDLLARTGRRLSHVVAGLPRVHMAHETVVTPWEQKGLVMRIARRAWPIASWCSSTA